MKFLDLFAGIGGFRLGMESAGHECVGYVEWEKYARQSYEAIHDTTGEWTAHDITKVDEKDVPDHDILCAGIPCQAFSVAGARKGFEDTRGTLFFDVARIAHEKKPKIILIENVKGLVSHDKGKTLDVIAKTLCDLGYVIDFNILNSKYFGVPQNRERIFIVAYREDAMEQSPWMGIDKKMLGKAKHRISDIEGIKTFNFDWPEQKQVTVKLRDILEPNVEEKFYLSDEKTSALVAQLNETTGKRIDSDDNGNVLQRSMSGVHKKELYGTLRAEASTTDFGVIEPTIFDVSQMGHEGKPRMYQDVAPTITAREYKEPRMVGVGHIGDQNMQGYRVYSPEGISPTLTTMAGGNTEPKIAEEQPQLRVAGNVNPSGNGIGGQVYDVRGGLSPTVIKGKGEGLKILDEVRPVLTPDRAKKRQNGRRMKENDEEAFTLTAQDIHGVAILRPVRTEYGKEIRKAYENGEINESRHNMRVLEPRPDDLCNTLTTIQKDNLLVEGLAIREPNQGIEHCDSAIKQYEQFYEEHGYLPELFNPYNRAELTDVSPTLTAQCTRINASSTVLKLEQGLPIREATKQGYAIAADGDAVNFQFPESNTRRGRVGKQIANTLEASNINQGVVEVMTEQINTIMSKSRPTTEIGITFKENGDIRTHQLDDKKSGVSELNINHEENQAHTVTSSHSPKIYGHTTQYRIRKLTPLECWKLQAFTPEQFEKAQNDGVSNSQLYKQAGNSVTVNVISEIAKRL